MIKILIDHRGLDVRHVDINSNESKKRPDVRREMKSLNRSIRTGCLVRVKSRKVKVDRIFDTKSEV